MCGSSSQRSTSGVSVFPSSPCFGSQGSLTAFGPYQLSWAGWPVSSLSLSISSHPHPYCPRAEVPDASCCTQPFNMGAGDPRAGPHMSAAYQLGHPPPPEACSQYLKAAIVPALFTMQRVMESC